MFLGWAAGAETGKEGKNHNTFLVRKMVAGTAALESGRGGGCKPLFDVKLRDWPIRLRLILCHVPLSPFLSARARTLSDIVGNLKSVTLEQTRSSLRAWWNFGREKGSVERKKERKRTVPVEYTLEDRGPRKLENMNYDPSKGFDR